MILKPFPHASTWQIPFYRPPIDLDVHLGPSGFFNAWANIDIESEPNKPPPISFTLKQPAYNAQLASISSIFTSLAPTCALWKVYSSRSVLQLVNSTLNRRPSKATATPPRSGVQKSNLFSFVPCFDFSPISKHSSWTHPLPTALDGPSTKIQEGFRWGTFPGWPPLASNCHAGSPRPGESLS
ncbi:hypothetical protein BC834DRAFT_143822 [Gloeopeniophorella convolvens]|nr:hypothetical protein BC834DRAFT_143822 [Gloeopeniophorella convolvens]